ncbi:hypothetical protein DXG01_015412 [Tephrocybe rancida]|nr:hypothetical protein DXG01_015412 [Tephrocybe rancida]
MPVFDGLFPSPHNELIQKLLFACAHWHALAKLCMHTDHTVNLLESVTASLGELFREFVGSTCAAYVTYELPREADARIRKESRKKDKNSNNSKTASPREAEVPSGSNRPHLSTAESSPLGVSTSTVIMNTTTELRHVPVLLRNAKALTTVTPFRKEPMKKATKRKKTFNISTYKFHALGDYPAMIKKYGTCDSYSTEPVSNTSELSWYPCDLIVFGCQGELEHRTPKARYRRTSKKDYIKQIAQIERRQAHLRQIRARVAPAPARAGPQACQGSEDNIAQDFAEHHQIGKSENQPEHIGLFYNDNLGDPAVKVICIPTFEVFLTFTDGAFLG